MTAPLPEDARPTPIRRRTASCPALRCRCCNGLRHLPPTAANLSGSPTADVPARIARCMHGRQARPSRSPSAGFDAAPGLESPAPVGNDHSAVVGLPQRRSHMGAVEVVERELATTARILAAMLIDALDFMSATLLNTVPTSIRDSTDFRRGRHPMSRRRIKSRPTANPLRARREDAGQPPWTGPASRRGWCRCSCYAAERGTHDPSSPVGCRCFRRSAGRSADRANVGIVAGQVVVRFTAPALSSSWPPGGPAHRGETTGESP
jgi:hypothetical protein